MFKTRIIEQDWDYLILLDACRYDYFERYWQNYLPGNLEKKLSIASSTRQWMKKTFTECYPDIIYLSSNPFINSVTSAYGFSGRKHFFKIYDLWHDEWDAARHTILPEKITNRAKEIVKAHPDKRAIIHYMQPHEPYIGVEKTDSVLHQPDPIRWDALHKIEGAPPKKVALIEKAMQLLQTFFYCIGLRGHLQVWKVREFLNLPPANHMDDVRRKRGKEGVRKAYAQNVQLVLKSVADLVSELSGKIVVTSDHGEMLGEDGCYGHWGRSSKKHLIEIPWLVIDKGKRITVSETQTVQNQQKGRDEKMNEETEKEIKEKLKALGYFG